MYSPLTYYFLATKLLIVIHSGKTMPTNLIILIAALIIAWIVFGAVVNLLKTFISTAIAIFVIIVVLRFFGFSPQDLMQEITNLAQTLRVFVAGGK